MSEWAVFRGFVTAALGFPLFTWEVLAGDLNPPGAPEPTMITLDEIEARTPIGQDDLPLTIDQPGSYYLTHSIAFDTVDTVGIDVNSHSVTIDLNGFTLAGPGRDVGASGHGIETGSHEAIAIRNGVIRDWRGDGIHIDFVSNVPYTTRIEHVIAIENGGIGISVGTGAIVEGCHAIDNGTTGIVCGDSCLVLNCISAANGTFGIVSPGGGGTIIQGNSCYDNGGDGINLDSGGLITGNNCYSNGGDGIFCRLTAVVTDNVCRYNTDSGIHLATAGSPTRGRCVVENNTVIGNAIGIEDTGNRNYLASNRANWNDTDYEIDPSSTEGTGDLANISY
jgi:hypothetical protein